jgi:simple sugar transport system substrate-binding protein
MHIAKRQKMSCLIVSGILAASSLFAMATMPAPASAEPKDNPTIFLFSGGLSDPFFGAIKKGADDAAKALGTTYQYLTITDRSDVMGNYTRLLEQSYARKPDVMIASVFFPAAMDPIVTKGVADGVPTFFMNSGLTSWKKDGAIAYIGEEPFTVGKQAGDVMAKAGVKHALCINHVPGNPLLELRCDGLADAFRPHRTTITMNRIMELPRVTHPVKKNDSSTV